MGRPRKNPGHANLKPRYGMRFCVVCGIGCRHWAEQTCFTCENIAGERRAPSEGVTGSLSQGTTCDACAEYCVCNRPRVPVKKFPGVKGTVRVCKTLAEQFLGDRVIRRTPSLPKLAETAQKVLYGETGDPEALSTTVQMLGNAFLSPKTPTK